MEFEHSSVINMLGHNEIVVLAMLAPILLGVYLGLKAW